ncbi:MAG: DUF1330 domain-containing protein [Spirochaetaceae bacterium]|nr:DUF1330 domain-containing protein [Spirochaetaceae bacterium]
MKAYIVTIDSEVTDREGMAGLASQLLQEVEAHGGRYLVRGGPISVYGGDLAPARAAISEFDSLEQAKALLESERFTELRKQRGKFVQANTFVVEGV